MLLPLLCALSVGRADLPTYSSGGVDIHYESFLPKATPKGVVVFAYGTHGMKKPQGPGHVRRAKLLAEAGYAVYLPYYFESTKEDSADMPRDRRNIATWRKAIEDMIALAEKQTSVDHVALAGFSLGGFFSVSEGFRNPEVTVVIDEYGAVTNFAYAIVKQTPPTLILHGESDRIVDIKESYTLRDYLTGKGAKVEFHSYPGAGHGFEGADEDDSNQRLIAFLNQYLK